MFLDFYKLREQPFGVTPDPRFLYFSPGHREALASLFYGIETGRGFLGLMAQPGMGKTTLLYQLIERLKDSVRHVFLFQTQCDSRELLRYLLDGLGLDGCDGDSVRMHAKLNEFLFRQAQAGQRVVVFIDEAQNLSDEVLESVRLLSDFEATDKKLLQIVLAGQPELAHRLLRPGMSQLRQRIAVLTHLRPLPRGEVIPYIKHRFGVAGYDGPELFTPDALALIAEHSQGVPRVINNICFSALSLGCASDCRKIGPELVRESIADFSLDSYVQPPAPAATLSRIDTPPTKPFATASSATPGNLLARALSFRPPQAIQRWLARAGAFVATLAILLFYIGERGQGRTADLPASPPHGQASKVGGLSAGDSQPASVVPEGPIKHENEANTLAPNREEPFLIYVVQSKDTLSKISQRILGRYDAAVLAEIRDLNWGLWDPDHIEAGRKLRIPLAIPDEPNPIQARKNPETRREPTP